jgi:hypothetical protein
MLMNTVVNDVGRQQSSQLRNMVTLPWPLPWHFLQ